LHSSDVYLFSICAGLFVRDIKCKEVSLRGFWRVDRWVCFGQKVEKEVMCISVYRVIKFMEYVYDTFGGLLGNFSNIY